MIQKKLAMSDEALVPYNNVIKSDPDGRAAYIAKVNIYEGVGKFNSTIKECEKYISI
jgi:hypothetical protein